jgi:hypothetical protein
MAEDWIKHLIHGIGHSARHEREKGHHSAANGWIMIGIGVFLLPIPILGLPLLGFGIWKVCKGG